MAGDWIAACKDLPEKPEVIALANATGKSRLEIAGFLLCRFWAWADGQTKDGVIPNCTVQNLCDLFHQPDVFWQTMKKVGWLSIGEDGIAIPKFDRWMGESAKQRLEKNRRQARWRANVGASVDAGASTKAPTTEQNRREEKRNKQFSENLQEPEEKQEPDKIKKSARKPRERDALFDSLSRVTASDPATCGSQLGRACRELRKADPPYTAADVDRFAELLPTEFSWLKGTPSIGFVLSRIGVLRVKPQKTGRPLTDDEIAHGTYDPQSGIVLNTRTCQSPSCQRPACVQAREDSG